MSGFGNAPILQDNQGGTPNDANEGAVINFAYASADELISIDLIDFNGGAASTFILTDGGGNTRTISLPDDWTGEPGVNGAPGFGTHDFDANNQVGFDGNIATFIDTGAFDLGGSGAIDNLRAVVVPLPLPAGLAAAGLGLIAGVRRRGCQEQPRSPLTTAGSDGPAFSCARRSLYLHVLTRDRSPTMPPALKAILLLTLSNVFMTFAWYAHLKSLNHRAWFVAALISWGIAFFEYMLQVPANRVGHQVMTVPQLKVLQEIITLSVFVPFAILYLKERPTLDYLWAGLCLVAAAYFMFREKAPAA